MFKSFFKEIFKAHLSPLMLNKFNFIGKDVYVQKGVEIEGAKNISLQDNVRIYKHSRLECRSNLSPIGRITIGKRTVIFPYAMLLTYGGFIEIGDDCSVNPYCILYGHGGLTIGNYVHIAAHTVIIPANHIYSNPNVPIACQKETRSGITVESDVWIGAGVKILDDVTIGKGSVVAAGAVVNKDVEPYSVVGGVPAKFIKRRGDK